MQPRARLAAVLLVTTIAVPFHASALSVNQYESKTIKERGKFVADYIEKVVTDVSSTNPALTKKIREYFSVTPSGQPFPLGVTAFEGELAAVEKMGKEGKLDMDKVQIEKILLDIIKTDLVEKQASKDGTDAPKK